jgi:hypothetical protein
MFRTAIKTLSLFRKVHNYNYNLRYRYRYVHSIPAFRKIEKPKLYNDALNMFMLSAFVKESIKNTNNSKDEEDANTRPVSNDDCEYCIKHKNYTNSRQDEKELKIMCQITGCEKRKNDIDCSCNDKCIVQKSEISIIADLL